MNFEPANPPTATAVAKAVGAAVDLAPPNSVVQTRTVVDEQGRRTSVITMEMQDTALLTPVPDDDREDWWERRL